MTTLVKRTFAGGEISPSIFMRGDTLKYQTGFEVGKNFLVARDGTLINRQGTGHVAVNKNPAYLSRYIDWVFNNNLSYVLELGRNYMRFTRQGVQIEIAPPAAWATTPTNYSIGDFVEYSGVNYYALRGSNEANQPDTSPDWWYALTGLIMEIPTPWDETQVYDVKYDQQGDVLHLVNDETNPQRLARTSDTGWIMVDFSPTPNVSRLGGHQLLATSITGTIQHKYAVTIVADTYEESQTILGVDQASPIQVLTLTDPVVITSAAHTKVNGQEVLIVNTGIPDLDDHTFLVANVAPNSFELEGVDGTGFQPAILGTSTAWGLYEDAVTGKPTEADPSRVKVSMAFLYSAGFRSGDIRYCNIYKDIGRGYGFIGSLDITVIDNTSVIDYSFYDDGISPALEVKPPFQVQYFAGTDDKPSTVQFVQQRLCFGSTKNNPQTLYLSRIGRYNNFTTSYLINADDAINFIMSGRTIEKVEHIIDATNLIVLTQGGEWVLAGDQNGTIRPTDVNARQIGYEGADKIQPIVIGNVVIYIQARSKQIRAIGFNNDIQGFDPTNLGKYADHLFEFKDIVDWGFQKLPDSVFWIVLNDGSMVTMTFVIDEGIIAFTHHVTDGLYESVCVVPEGSDDIVYVGVKRTIDGTVQRSLERMPVREIQTVLNDAYFVDNYSVYDGTNTTADTMTLTSAGLWGVDDGPFNVADSGGSFLVGDVGNTIVLTVDETLIVDQVPVTTTYVLTCTLTAFVDANNFTCEVSKDVPIQLQAVALTTWGKGITLFKNNTHLANKVVSILADGSVLDQETVTVGGDLTISIPSVIVRYGLPYVSELVTLDFEIPGQETLLDKKKHFNTMHMMVNKTRGGWSGPKGGAFGGKMYEIKQLTAAKVNDPESMLINGIIENIMQAVWANTGALRIEQRDPLPMHLLGLMPAGRMGGA